MRSPTLSVVILTYNERLHIRRCMERIRPIATEIFVVDCHSTDGPQEIARGLGATVVEHDWPGLYAVQLNWALDNLPLTGEWTLRLDADEYLEEATVRDLPAFLARQSQEVEGVTLRLGRVFLGRAMRHGLGTIRLLRVFRTGRGRCEGKLMDAAYFAYRYVLRLGFLDGREGFLWHFLQGWWYRTLVDAKVMELTKCLKLTGGGSLPRLRLGIC